MQCWGDDAFGQLGAGRTYTYTPSSVVGANGQGSLNLFTTLGPLNLTVTGPSTLQSGGRIALISKANYTDGSLRTVNPAWSSSNPSAASVSSAGVLSAGVVAVDTSVILTATFTDGGVTVKATLDVTITAAPAALVSLQFTGVTQTQSGAQVRTTLTARYTDGSERPVSGAVYSVSNAALGSVNSRGVLTVGSVDVDTALAVTASYTEGAVTKSAQVSLTIVAAPATLLRLTLIGARGALGADETMPLAAEGVYSDGSRKSVKPSWIASGEAASVSDAGVVTARPVSQDASSLITATYGEGDITVRAQFQVLVTAVPAPPPPIQAEVEITGTQADFGLSIWASLNAVSTNLGGPRAKSSRGIAATGPASYKLFVVAVVPSGALLPVATPFLLNRSREWQLFTGFPLAEYLAGVSDNSFQLIELFDHLDASLITGTNIYVGYGTSDIEMVESGRFRLVYQVQ